MKPYLSIASTINETKPNLKEFWSTINSNTADSKFFELINEPYSDLNLFKLELLLIYMETHNRIYLYSKSAIAFKEYLDEQHIITNGLFDVNRSYTSIKNFTLRASKPISATLILGNVIEAKQYLNPYLRSKLSAHESVSTAYSKSIEPNLMSLAIFQHWITTIKPFNSVQAEEFIKQCVNFPEDFKNDFINSILGHCKTHSISLQKYLIDYCGNLKNYPSINRYKIRNNSRQKITFAAVLDPADSFYKPFVANTNRPAPDTNSEVEATLGYAFAALQQPEYSQVLYDELIKHAQQAPSNILDIYKTNLLVAQTALNKLIKDL